MGNGKDIRSKEFGMTCKVRMLLSCLGFFALGVSSVHAQTEIQKGNCGLISVDSKGDIAFPLMVVEGEVQLSSNPGGNTLIQCHGKMPQRPYKQVILDYASTADVIGTGIFCFTPWGEATQDWKQVVSPNGQATLTCHLNASSKR